MVGIGWEKLGMVGNGWEWSEMVGHGYVGMVGYGDEML